MNKYFEELNDKFDNLSDVEFDELLKASSIENYTVDDIQE